MKTAQRDRGAKAPVEKKRQPRRRSKKETSPDRKLPNEEGFLFQDPYWDDQFCSYYDPTLRTCCNR